MDASMNAVKARAIFLPRAAVAQGLFAVPEITVHWDRVPLAAMQTMSEWPELVKEGGKVADLFAPVFASKFTFDTVRAAVLGLVKVWPELQAEGGKAATIWAPVFEASK